MASATALSSMAPGSSNSNDACAVDKLLLIGRDRLLSAAFRQAVAQAHAARTAVNRYVGSPLPAERSAFKHTCNTSKLQGASMEASVKLIWMLLLLLLLLTIYLLSAESSESPCCCCQQDDSENSCSTNSEGDKKHDCPCRKHRTVGAKLGDSQILPTSPSVQWMLELSEICTPVCFLSADELSPQRKWLLLCRFDSMPTGTEILIAHSVRRC